MCFRVCFNGFQGVLRCVSRYVKVCFFSPQLPQVEAVGSELNGRRFRIESGDALGDREEVSTGGGGGGVATCMLPSQIRAA